MSQPDKNDTKKGPIIPVQESGRDLPEDEPKQESLKYYQVLCPKCRARPGFPCCFNLVGEKPKLDPWSIHIARISAYEAYMIGVINELGIDSNGKMLRGSLGRE